MRALVRWLVVVLVAGSLWPAGASAYRRYGGGGGGGTVASAYMYGMGSVIRSQGQYDLMAAQAAIAAQQAEQLYLQNRIAATKTYFEMREMNRQYQQEERGKIPSRDALSGYYEQMKPHRLSATQLDPVTGKIGWPQVLMEAPYAPFREQLEPSFALWAGHQEVNYNDIRHATDAMQAELKKHITELNSQDYETAHKFIDSLAYEAHFPPS